MSRLHNRARRSDQPLVYVIERFPFYWGRIRRLADTDKKFSDLCRDYADAIERYRFWRERREPRAIERAHDYITIASELEAELLREIAEDDRRDE